MTAPKPPAPARSIAAPSPAAVRARKEASALKAIAARRDVQLGVGLAIAGVALGLYLGVKVKRPAGLPSLVDKVPCAPCAERDAAIAASMAGSYKGGPQAQAQPPVVPFDQLQLLAEQRAQQAAQAAAAGGSSAPVAMPPGNPTTFSALNGQTAQTAMGGTQLAPGSSAPKPIPAGAPTVFSPLNGDTALIAADAPG